MNMKNSREILVSALKTAQMGQIGIRSVLGTTMCPGLRADLETQLREYDRIETEAHTIASQRGWELDELDPAVRTMADMLARVRLTGKHHDSAIADMVIMGNTKGMVKSLRGLNHFSGTDERVSALMQKLLDTETANIHQMQSYL